MSKAVVGGLFVILIFHALLVAVPLWQTLRARISNRSKAIWSLFLILVPFIGAGIFHYRFRSSLFEGKAYEPRSEDVGGPPSEFSRDDKNR